MNDIYITLTGNVAAEPRQYSFEDGSRVTSLKVFSSHRYFDKKTGQWTDGDRVCFTVRCWRALGDNVAASMRAGHPVVVSGKLRIREFGPEGDRRFMPEIEASAVGHDLRWGTGVFTKPDRSGIASISKEMRERLDEETRDWAMGTRNLRALNRSGPTTEANPFHALDADSEAGSDFDPAGAFAAEAGPDPAREAEGVPMPGEESHPARSQEGEDAPLASLGSEDGTVRILSADSDPAAHVDEEDGTDAGELDLKERVAA